MDKKKLYESIMMSVAKEVKKAINESYNEPYDNTILEKYGISYIFALNEGESTNIFQKFKQPLQDALNKVKNKFGNRPCKVIADIIKKAQSKGKKTLYGILTAITLLTGTLPANAININGFDDSLRDSMVTSTVNMTRARGIQGGEELEAVKKQASEDFIKILYALDDDTNNRYASSGAGCATSEVEAKQLAQEDAEKNLKMKYGEDAIEKYKIQFKTIGIQSFRQNKTINGKTISTIYYTAITVAYQSVK